MATLSEYRDHDTGLHLQRVSQLCRILADELRRTPPLDGYITDEYVEDLVLSSVLHDIGKVGVPDSVLLKPGRLTEEEFEAVKAHAVVGGDALDSVEKRMDGRSFFTLGKQIAYSHHERWDGKGYPRGLSGDAIPLSARIVAVADTYDAITSDRIYRAALPHEEAMRRILAERGTQFDPCVVDALVAAQNSVRLVAGAQEN
jgi:HD-GYP domain-containing protein (c-di-GMP phosphodiesterase class II)